RGGKAAIYPDFRPSLLEQPLMLTLINPLTGAPDIILQGPEGLQISLDRDFAAIGAEAGARHRLQVHLNALFTPDPLPRGLGGPRRHANTHATGDEQTQYQLHVCASI